MTCIISYAGPTQDGLPVKDQGWRLYELTYARSRNGQPIKRKIQHPYRKLRGVFATYDEASDAAITLGIN